MLARGTTQSGSPSRLSRRAGCGVSERRRRLLRRRSSGREANITCRCLLVQLRTTTGCTTPTTSSSDGLLRSDFRTSQPSTRQGRARRGGLGARRKRVRVPTAARSESLSQAGTGEGPRKRSRREHERGSGRIVLGGVTGATRPRHVTLQRSSREVEQGPTLRTTSSPGEFSKRSPKARKCGSRRLQRSASHPVLGSSLDPAAAVMPPRRRGCSRGGTKIAATPARRTRAGRSGQEASVERCERKRHDDGACNHAAGASAVAYPASLRCHQRGDRDGHRERPRTISARRSGRDSALWRAENLRLMKHRRCAPSRGSKAGASRPRRSCSNHASNGARIDVDCRLQLSERSPTSALSLGRDRSLKRGRKHRP